MMVQATKEADPHHKPTITRPSTSQPQKKQKSRRKQRKEAEVPQDEAEHEDNIPTTSNNLLPSGDLDNSTNNFLIPLDSWTSGLLVYRLTLSGLLCQCITSDSQIQSISDEGVADDAGKKTELKKNAEADFAIVRSSSKNELYTPFKDHEREFRSSKRHFKSLSFNGLRSSDFDLLSDQENLDEEEEETIAETMEQYMSKTRTDYGSGVATFKIGGDFVLQWVGYFDTQTRQILDSRGAIPTKTAADAKKAIQEMAEYSQKWHNGTSKGRSTETSDGLAAIQAQLNNMGREIKKVNEKVYVAQVGCEQCKRPYYTKDCVGIKRLHGVTTAQEERRGIKEMILMPTIEEGTLMNVPIFVGIFSVMTDFAVLEDMDAYLNEGMGVAIFGEPFLREVGIKTKWFDGMITIYNGDDEVTYQMVRSHPRNGISYAYQKIKGFYKGVLNLGPDYIRDAKMEEWLTRGHISVHELD
ncbi:hypothetical protein Tco_0865339 [Tanacetum coccineum]